MEQRKKTKLAVAVDLGALYTGVFIVNHDANSLEQKNDTLAATIVMPKDKEKNGITYRQDDRTTIRHRLRSSARYYEARRLLLLIVNNFILDNYLNNSADNVVSPDLVEALCGLLKRRGYNRVVTEIDLSVLEECDLKIFANYGPLKQYFSNFGNYSSLLELWDFVKQDLSVVKKLSDTVFSDKTDNFAQYIKNEVDDKKAENLYKSAYTKIKDDCNQIKSQSIMGHFHRKDYIDDIEKVIKKDSRLFELTEHLSKKYAADGVKCLANLVGNISNLQLRALRWYFNDKRFINGDFLDNEKLKKSLIRSLNYVNLTTADNLDKLKTNAKLTQILRKSDDIVRSLCEIDPKDTIPPYENQDNRNTPVDQTLWLSPDALNKLYGNKWVDWADLFLKDDHCLEESLDEILSLSDRKSRVKSLGGNPLEKIFYRYSYILQRVLDKNSVTDKFFIRKLATGKIDKNIDNCKKHLVSLLGEDTDYFLKFAQKYYKEIGDAKNGIWNHHDNSLLERADIHPCKKVNVINILVGKVLGQDAEFGQAFIDQHWNSGILGRSSIKTISKGIADVYKKYRNGFKIAYESAIDKDNKHETLDNDEKELVKISKNIDRLKKVLDDKAQDSLLANTLKRICDPFMLYQLYQHIETKRDGYTNISKAAHLENSWRLTNIVQVNGINSTGNQDEVDVHSEYVARCSVLPADSVRPFDGIVSRMLDRVAYEVAKQVKKSVELKQVKNSDIDFSVIVEQNSFAFTESLSELKNVSGANKKSVGLDPWENKLNRIKNASKGICPYMGTPLNESGDIDHILARAKSKDMNGAVYNSEANLIFASVEGNRKKNDCEFFLKDLHDNYLDQIFGNHDRADIELKIETVVNNLNEKGMLTRFVSLSESDQACVRHSLFLHRSSKARKLVEKVLNTQNKTIVNGSQSYFVKLLLNKVEQILSDWNISYNNTITCNAMSVDATISSHSRMKLGDKYPEFKKIKPQPTISHSIDAMCVYASACGNRKFNEFLGGNSDLAFVDSSDNNLETLRNLYPEGCEFINVTRKNLDQLDNIFKRSIFKEKIIGQEFLPIIKKDDSVYIGFSIPKKDADNISNYSVTVGGDKPCELIDLLYPYFDDKSTSVSKVGGLNTYKIDKSKALDLFSKVIENQASSEELLIAEILSNISYRTEHIDPSNLLIKNSKVIGETDFKKILSVKNIPELRSKNISNKLSKPVNFSIPNGEINFPFFHEWRQVYKILANYVESNERLHNLKVSEKLRANIELSEDDQKFDASKLSNTQISEFIQKLKNDFNHCSTRNIKNNRYSHKGNVSLKLCKTSAGSLFNIKRRNFKNESIYQLYDSNCAYKGFLIDSDGNINFKKCILYEQLSSKSIKSSDIKNVNISSEERIASMSMRRCILNDKNNLISVWMSLTSSNRSLLEVKLPFNIFKDWLVSLDNLNNKDKKSAFIIPNSIFDVKPSYKFNKYSSLFEILENSDIEFEFDDGFKLENIFSIPRADVDILEVNDNFIRFKYMAVSRNQYMQDAFNRVKE